MIPQPKKLSRKKLISLLAAPMLVKPLAAKMVMSLSSWKSKSKKTKVSGLGS